MVCVNMKCREYNNIRQYNPSQDIGDETDILVMLLGVMVGIGVREDLCFIFKERDNKGELKLNFSDLFDFCSSWMIKRRKDYLIWIVMRHRFSTY